MCRKKGLFQLFKVSFSITRKQTNRPSMKNDSWRRWWWKWSHMSSTEKISHSHIRQWSERRRANHALFPTTPQTANDTHTNTHVQAHTPTRSVKQCIDTHSPPTQKHTHQHMQRRAPKRKERRSWIVRWARESPPLFFFFFWNPGSTHTFFFL